MKRKLSESLLTEMLKPVRVVTVTQDGVRINGIQYNHPTLIKYHRCRVDARVAPDQSAANIYSPGGRLVCTATAQHKIQRPPAELLSNALKQKSKDRKAVKAFYSELERPFAGHFEPFLKPVMRELSQAIEHAKHALRTLRNRELISEGIDPTSLLPMSRPGVQSLVEILKSGVQADLRAAGSKLSRETKSRSPRDNHTFFAASATPPTPRSTPSAQPPQRTASRPRLGGGLCSTAAHPKRTPPAAATLPVEPKSASTTASVSKRSSPQSTGITLEKLAKIAGLSIQQVRHLVLPASQQSSV